MEQTPVYTAPPVPFCEDERLAELHGLALLDTASEARFDDYTSLIADIFDFPIVLVSLIDSDRQWFKSSCGLELRETSRDVSFCAHAINYNSVFVVPDTHQDSRFAQNPLVTGEPFIRFYAGAVVRGPNGFPLGTLCLLDRTVRQFTEQDKNRLIRFAELVQREIKHRSDLVTLRASIEYSAYYDPLTKVANRRLLLDRLQKLIEAAARDQSQIALLLFNIADLRLINQSFGSDAGDALLVQVAERLHQCNPSGGTLARLQGDEFVVTFGLPQAEGDALELKLDDTRSILAAPFQVLGREYHLNIKCGVSLFPKDGVTGLQLIERASMAVRIPRFSSGSPNVRFFNTAETVSLGERLEMESRLRLALETRAFSMVYQPIVCLQDGSLSSLEALIRWHDEVLGDVPPAKFIPVAESSGLIIALGHWVLEEVCSQLETWNHQKGWQTATAINVSVTELMQPGFAIGLLQRLDSGQISRKSLTLEITETSIASDNAMVKENIDILVKGGICLAIDDFGTGYSALGYLHSLPISHLKIDRSFVAGLPENRNDAILSQTIISMAQGLKLETVSEGIESKEQLDFLIKAGCRYAQGFLISHPVPAADIASLQGRRLI